MTARSRVTATCAALALLATTAPAAAIATPVTAPLLEAQAPPAVATVTTTTAATASRDQAATPRTISGAFTSRYWPGRRVTWKAAVPRGRPLGTVVVLHGKTDDASYAFAQLDLLAQARRSGFALVTVDGESTYWHADGAGTDTGLMVMRELLPAVSTRGLRTERIGLTGYSMGGLGALVIAQRIGPSRVFAVAPMSAAIHDPNHQAGRAEMAAQAYVRRHVRSLRGIPVSLVCGTEDHLIASNRAFARQIPGAVRTEYRAGGHDFAYWRPALSRQLSWMADRL